jgi:hypothetical protein
MHLVRDDLGDDLAALEGDKLVRKCVTSRNESEQGLQTASR